MSTTPMRSSRPSTPVSQSPATPGKWRHPQFEEILRRQQATTFTEQNIAKVVHNILAMMALWILQKCVEKYLPLPYLAHRLSPIWSYLAYGTSYLLLALRILFFCNIFAACKPLIRPKDDLADIPLTPAQRQLLGLGPTSTPPTPGSVYVTPARIAHTPHSSPPSTRSASHSNSRNDSTHAGSISGNSGVPSNFGQSSFESPYSASPLLHKAMGGARNNQLKRQSFGASSIGPGTPSPLGGTGTKTTMNNSKWLYERRKTSPAPKIFF